MCGHVSSRVHYDLLKVFALEGKTWLKGAEFPNAQVIAASLSDENQFMSGFYRTVSDVEGAFRFVALLPDAYILYAFPDTVDVESSGCYYLGEWQWGESNMIEVDGDVYDVDIELANPGCAKAMPTRIAPKVSPTWASCCSTPTSSGCWDLP